MPLSLGDPMNSDDPGDSELNDNVEVNVLS